MVEFLIAGVVLGCIFALASTALSVSFTSTGIFNLAFTAQAYFVARLYYFLNSQSNLSSWISGILAIVVAGFVLGVLLNFLVFRHLRQSPTLIKLVGTIGLAVSLPAITELIFGNVPIAAAPGLASQTAVFTVVGVTITLDQVIVVAIVLIIGVFGVLAFGLTNVGLAVRAAVDSEAMSGISGINTSMLSTFVWGLSGLLAGLAGVLVAPQIGLGATNFTLLLTGAFAAVVLARFRNIGVALCASLLIGLSTEMLEYVLPTTSSFTTAVIASVPLGAMAIFIVVDTISRRAAPLEVRLGGPLDSAIRVQRAHSHSTSALADAHASEAHRPVPRLLMRRMNWAGSLNHARPIALVFGLLIVALFILDDFWVGVIVGGLAMAIAFLSINVISGEAGMIWLCQITLVGVGAISYAQLAAAGLPFLASLLVTALLTGLVGFVIGVVVVRVGDLYMALITFSIAILIEQLVFTLPRFYQNNLGQSVNLPSVTTNDRTFGLLVILVFALLSIVLARLRKSTTGLALSAVRSSQRGSRSLGLSVISLMLFASTLGAFVAGIAGAVLAIYAGSAQTSSYEALIGWVWLAVAVTVGIRSAGAALLAGLLFSVVPALFLLYLPSTISEIPTVLFGAGAILIARNPEGVLLMHRRQLSKLAIRWRWLAINRSPLRSSMPHVPLVADAGTPASIPHRGVFLASHTNAANGSVTFPANLQIPHHGVGHEVIENSVADDSVALKAEGISVQFGGLQALSNVRIEARRGEITALAGPNGAGKSTLFDVLSGFHASESGRVWLNGVDISTRSPQARAHMGLYRTFQHPELFWTLTPREHVLLGYRAGQDPKRVWRDWFRSATKWGGAAETEYVAWILELLGLGEVADRNVAELPLGFAKRIEVARAIAATPKVLLLDEPCSGLDPQEAERLMDVLREIIDRETMTVVLVEHNLGVLMKHSDMITVLDRGEVIANGTAAEIQTDMRVRTAYLGG